MKVAVGSTYLAYIDDCGMVFTVSYDSDFNTLNSPKLIQLGDKIKHVGVGLAHSFAVTEEDKVYVWTKGEEP